MRSVKMAVRIVLALLMVALFSGCTILQEGEFGLERSYFKEFNETPKYGTQMTMWDTIYPVTAREFLLPVDNVRPKDLKGIMLEELDIVYTIRHKDHAAAIKFFRERGDRVCLQEINACVIGWNYLKKDAGANLGETIRKFNSVDLLDKRKDVEKALAEDFQKELDTLYGVGVFEIMEAKLAVVRVSKNIEERIQAVALIETEKERSKATMEVLKIREETSRAEYSVLVNAARGSGMTVDQALEYKRLDVIKDMPSGGATNINVDAK